MYLYIYKNKYLFFFCCDCSITLKCNNTCNIGYNFKKYSQQKKSQKLHITQFMTVMILEGSHALDLD